MTGRSMQAIRLYGPQQPVRLEEVPYPEPVPGEVVVRVAACGICGSDLHFLEDMPAPVLPITMGHEPAGVIEAVGADVRGWCEGDRVALHLGAGCGRCRGCALDHPSSCENIRAPGLHIDGAFAEAIRVPTNTLVRVPDGVSFAAAAVATDCVATPFHALRCRGQLRPDERVVVIGVGGLGGQSISMARAQGAGQVVAVDVSEAALKRAERHGATDTLLVGAQDDPIPALHELTSGGADLALECVGKPDTVSLGARALCPGGRLVVIGVGMQPPRLDVPLVEFSVSELTVLGSFGSHIEDLAEVLRMQAEGRIDIEAHISHRLRLEEVPSGLEMLRTKRDHPERIVVEVDPRL